MEVTVFDVFSISASLIILCIAAFLLGRQYERDVFLMWLGRRGYAVVKVCKEEEKECD